MTIALVDDQVLGAVLRDDPPPAVAADALATTGCWYLRLCQAVLRSTDRPGALAAPIARLPPALRERAIRSVLALPEGVVLRSLRHLAPDVAHIRERHALNLLAAEAVAAASDLGARVVLATPSPRLQAALDDEGIDHVLVG